ncbi:MAG: right-handed parallel beta-helix repeat-containing protein [Planctomycetia bacterium]|nr:right-handed parallel beta-helix repeat-containing protein [Planctomycetia bacterium]
MIRLRGLLFGAGIFSLSLAWACRAFGEEAAGSPSTPAISGWVERDGRWVPAEPFVAGQQRATGLQAPFPPMRSIDKNPMTPEKVELGKLLFFDPILSGENTISCAHCHHPDYGFADGRKLSMGFGGKGVGPERSGGDQLGRAAPALWNAAYNKWQFWDGRADDLEAQAAGPVTNEHEMGEKPERLEKELRAIPEYVALFQKVFGGTPDEAVTFRNVTQAIAAFERTLLTFNSKFDRYAAGDLAALNDQERSGMKVFRSLKTRCFECHNFPTFADDTFRVIGVPEKGERDRGRASVPGEGPAGAFKTPTLRNIALSAPYMHNGAFDTLEEVIKFYGKGGGRGEPNPPEGIDDKIGKFDITDAEIADLVAFLKALTDTSLQPDPPKRVPSGLPVVEVKTKAMPAPPVALARASRAAAPVSAAPPAASAPSNVAAARPNAPLSGYSSGNMQRVPGQAAVSVVSGSAGKARAGREGVAATFTVSPGQSIQAAVDRCKPGDRVEVEPGVYRQSVVIDTDGVTLAGMVRQGARAVLDGGGELADAVQSSASDLTIEGLTIRRYKGNGVMVSKAKNVAFRDLVLDEPGLYGVYPVECAGVLVETCTVSGASDAAIYVGSSRDIVVRNNEVFNNVAGIEIENCVGAVVTNNSAHHNSGGILVFVLPNNPSKVGSDCRVINNRSWANNHENFGKPGTTIANLPTGIGILVMAADRTEVTQNQVAENDSYGIVVVQLAGAQQPDRAKLDVEPNSDYTLISGNEYRANGRHPHKRFTTAQASGGDLFWDGTGVENRWRESGDVVTFPKDLLHPAASAAAASTDTTLPKPTGGSR